MSVTCFASPLYGSSGRRRFPTLRRYYALRGEGCQVLYQECDTEPADEPAVWLLDGTPLGGLKRPGQLTTFCVPAHFAWSIECPRAVANHSPWSNRYAVDAWVGELYSGCKLARSYISIRTY